MPWRKAPAWAAMPPPCRWPIRPSGPASRQSQAADGCCAARSRARNSRRGSSVDEMVPVPGFRMSGDGGLALAGGLVARSGGQVDGGARDRLGKVLDLAVLLGLRLLVLVERIGIGRLLGRERVDAFRNDVHFQVGSRYRGFTRGAGSSSSTSSASAAARPRRGLRGDPGCARRPPRRRAPPMDSSTVASARPAQPTTGSSATASTLASASA